MARSLAATATAAVALAGALVVGMLAGCAPDDDDDEAGRELTVFAAASLTGPMTRIAAEFEREHPGVRVRLSFDGSSGLVDQVSAGAPADVLATADTRTMDRAVAQGLTAGEPVEFATNVLTLITPPGNPAGITGLDASLAGTRLVVCAEAVPCGSAARALAADAGVELSPVSEESSVTDVRGKVASGEADAGIVYTTDVRTTDVQTTDAAAAADAVAQIPIAGADARPNHYPAAVLAGAADPGLARRFVDAVSGAAGRPALADAGFGPP